MKTSDYTEEPRKDETRLQFKMNKHFIISRKIYQNEYIPYVRDLRSNVELRTGVEILSTSMSWRLQALDFPPEIEICWLD